jgi:exodeoxyribonuclease III
MKIATWNVNSLKVRLPQVLDWISAECPDVLGLQETKLTDDKFPRADIEAAGYRVAFAGQKTYNGVALLSRAPLADIVTDLPGLEDPQRRVLGATIGGVRVLNLYVPNGESVESAKYAYKLDWLAGLARYATEQLAAHPRLVLIGDFNIAPEERDVHDPEAWAGQVLFSDRERAAFRALVDAGLCDTFRLFGQAEGSYSWWDYRMGAFRRNRGLRIDHILASPALCETCRACRIDTGPRAAERPSDHAPVVAEFDVE